MKNSVVKLAKKVSAILDGENRSSAAQAAALCCVIAIYSGAPDERQRALESMIEFMREAMKRMEARRR
jgi:hypothetical protein